MIVEISTSEVEKLAHIFFKAYLNEDKKYYAINEEPLYSYDENKRKAKKKERQQCLINESMYLDYYHYWDCRIGHIHHPQIPYIDDIGTLDIDPNELLKTQILLHTMLLDASTTSDISELSSAYHYWIRVSTGDNSGN